MGNPRNEHKLKKISYMYLFIMVKAGKYHDVWGEKGTMCRSLFSPFTMNI